MYFAVDATQIAKTLKVRRDRAQTMQYSDVNRLRSCCCVPAHPVQDMVTYRTPLLKQLDFNTCQSDLAIASRSNAALAATGLCLCRRLTKGSMSSNRHMLLIRSSLIFHTLGSA